MDLFPRGVRARVLSAYYLAMPLGAALGLGVGAAIARAATWHTAFLVAGAPGVVLALLALVLPDPLRGTSEGVEPQTPEAARAGRPSRDDYIDLMVNSSYTYSVFGLAFSMFAIGGLVFWLPTFLLVVHEMPAGHASSSWLGLTVPGGHGAGHGDRRLAGGPLLADQPAGPVPRAGRGDAGLDPVPPAGDLRPRPRRRSTWACSLAIALMFTNAGPCYAIIANVVMPNMRAVACAVAMAATHLLGDIWSPTLMGWVADTFGQADSMATPFGQALAAIGAVPRAQPGRDPENLAAALLIAVPALVIAGIVLLAGAGTCPARWPSCSPS